MKLQSVAEVVTIAEAEERKISEIMIQQEVQINRPNEEIFAEMADGTLSHPAEAVVGVKSVMPTDEVISAMYKMGQMMPVALKETALGGLATTPTARAFKQKIFGLEAKDL
jgi:L-serine deaminase